MDRDNRGRAAAAVIYEATIWISGRETTPPARNYHSKPSADLIDCEIRRILRVGERSTASTVEECCRDPRPFRALDSCRIKTNCRLR